MLQTTLKNKDSAAIQGPWKAYDQWIEENADHAAYTAASPENALVLVGPNRSTTELTSLTPIGLLQNFTVGQSINWQAQQMIGSGRTFFLAGKVPGNGTLTRLFTSASTLLGAIYAHNVAKVGKGTEYESKPYYSTVTRDGIDPTKIMFTLDTELLKIPFGLCALFRNTARQFIGGFYVEHAVIPNINIGFAVGQPAVFETVNILFDRVVPFDVMPTDMMSPIATNFANAITGEASA